ncbi:DUF5666 domain-containing protein [Pimelobacter simplex]|uniref:DUF5666 domain-containing protein n=1 Tax=Nocardioides simplex TaxID=2045 RepID=UPI0021503E01|nr:DUF5666 domain-containing protein [Pimelobacter simplex]UUW89071.1 DUF5666 domain-containing protein [Pimelobacter simplex]UUW98575.1 DUF5666 domain-containing protein [Pimelobacter simplex]
MTSIPIRTDRPVALLATGAFMALVLAGCGSDDGATPAAAGTAGARTDVLGEAPAGAVRPGTSGQIAAVDGKVLQVRSPMSGQVAVTVTDQTKVTDQVAGTYADVTVGACVVVRSAADPASASASAGSGTDTETATTASAVAVQASGDDGCTGPGAGGGGGQRPSGMPTDRPTERPSDLPSDLTGGAPGRMGGVAFGVRGEVTSVADGSFVVTSPGPDGDRTVTVTVDSTTTYTHQAAATAAALTQGRCVQVSGDADDTGAVTATAIQVSDAVEDQCGR